MNFLNRSNSLEELRLGFQNWQPKNLLNQYPYTLFHKKDSWGYDYNKTYVCEVGIPKDIFEMVDVRFYEKELLRFCLGKNEEGDFEFETMKNAHMLIGGITGAGKSNFINYIIFSLLHNNHPEYLQLACMDGIAGAHSTLGETSSTLLMSTRRQKKCSKK